MPFVDPSQLDIPHDAPVDEAFLHETMQQLQELGPELMKAKMQEHRLLQESIANGGPASQAEAIIGMMAMYKIGYREMAAAIKVKRKIFLGMVEGRLEFPIDVASQCHQVIMAKADKERKLKAKKAIREQQGKLL